MKDVIFQYLTYFSLKIPNANYSGWKKGFQWNKAYDGLPLWSGSMPPSGIKKTKLIRIRFMFGDTKTVQFIKNGLKFSVWINQELFTVQVKSALSTQKV